MKGQTTPRSATKTRLAAEVLIFGTLAVGLWLGITRYWSQSETRVMFLRSAGAVLHKPPGSRWTNLPSAEPTIRLIATIVQSKTTIEQSRRRTLNAFDPLFGTDLESTEYPIRVRSMAIIETIGADGRARQRVVTQGKYLDDHYDRATTREGRLLDEADLPQVYYVSPGSVVIAVPCLSGCDRSTSDFSRCLAQVDFSDAQVRNNKSANFVCVPPPEL